MALIVSRIFRYGDKNVSRLKPSPVTGSMYREEVKEKPQLTEKAAVRLLERCLGGRSLETKYVRNAAPGKWGKQIFAVELQ